MAKSAKHNSLINNKKECKECGQAGTYQRTLFCYEHFKEYQKLQMRWRNKLKKNFWTEDYYNEQWLRQGEQCGICGVKENNSRLAFSTDHNHKTDRPRMILCHRCNTNVGIIENKDRDYVLKIIDYLESFE
jgi:hypothetical protein